MDFFMIDTVVASSSEGKYGAELLEEFPDVEYPPNAPTSAAQWAWLEAGLKASTADYVWVGGHYPVWSGCTALVLCTVDSAVDPRPSHPLSSVEWPSLFAPWILPSTLDPCQPITVWLHGPRSLHHTMDISIVRMYSRPLTHTPPEGHQHDPPPQAMVDHR
jgi:hypothetical protein